MPCPNCRLGCCQYGMPLHETHEEFADISNHNGRPSLPSREQEPEGSTLYQDILSFPYGVSNAPINSWPQSACAELGCIDNPSNAMHFMENPLLGQMAGYQSFYHQPRDHGYSFVPNIHHPFSDVHSTTQEPMLGHSRATAIPSTPRSDPINIPLVSDTLKCHWNGCRYGGTFGRKSELKRHVETQHIYPMAYQCPFPECGSEHNRKDNLQAHLQNAHGISRSLKGMAN